MSAFTGAQKARQDISETYKLDHWERIFFALKLALKSNAPYQCADTPGLKYYIWIFPLLLFVQAEWNPEFDQQHIDSCLNVVPHTTGRWTESLRGSLFNSPFWPSRRAFSTSVWLSDLPPASRTISDSSVVWECVGPLSAVCLSRSASIHLKMLCSQAGVHCLSRVLAFCLCLLNLSSRVSLHENQALWHCWKHSHSI